MNNLDLFDELPEGFRLATEEDMPLVNLTLAQAFADYTYPIPTVNVPYSALLKFYYELGSNCSSNALKNGAVLTNEDFSAVMCLAPFEKRTEYNVKKLYQILIDNSTKEAADNMMKIFDYIGEEEAKIDVKDGCVFVDMFAVQTPKQGNKLGSKLMRRLFAECEKANRDLFLYTNTERNKSIYNHFGYVTVSEIHNDSLDSATYYLYWKPTNRN